MMCLTRWWRHTQQQLTHWGRDKLDAISQTTFSSAFSWMKMYELRLKIHWSLFLRVQLHQPRLWFITGGYLVKRWLITTTARARGQSNDLNREILASNIFNCHKEVINAPPVPSISKCIHIVYRHKNVWEYQWSNFIYNCMSTFLHYVHCKDALLDCSSPGGERCESLSWVDEINNIPALVCLVGAKPLSDPMMVRLPTHICVTRPQWVQMCL